MAKLSININKIALLRNARGGNIPNVIQFAMDCEKYGAQGITVHPRPDERHITKKDVYALKEVVTTEFNIEGYPSEDFLKMVLEVKPAQCTLVPDLPNQLTSDHGWDCVQHKEFLLKIISKLQENGIRVSLFIDPMKEQLEAAKITGTNRIEFYTGPYAHDFYLEKNKAISAFSEAAKVCTELGLGINAGHDLNLDNLKFFKENVAHLLEVSIGQAFVSDCLYYGLENTIQLYRRQLA
ncbi:MAG: pyridoxine 5'-phosphate synthase [Bacteroidetes bacterium 37-13]|nr:MAG: pyridoxine 5'-phosphate synthase [Bacteroidetes bacterium 37-13]